MRNGQPIDINDPNEGIEIIVGADYVDIKFNKPRKLDLGRYEMQMTNTAGTTSAGFEMDVKGT